MNMRTTTMTILIALSLSTVAIPVQATEAGGYTLLEDDSVACEHEAENNDDPEAGHSYSICYGYMGDDKTCAKREVSKGTTPDEGEYHHTEESYCVEHGFVDSRTTSSAAPSYGVNCSTDNRTDDDGYDRRKECTAATGWHGNTLCLFAWEYQYDHGNGGKGNHHGGTCVR